MIYCKYLFMETLKTQSYHNSNPCFLECLTSWGPCLVASCLAEPSPSGHSIMCLNYIYTHDAVFCSICYISYTQAQQNKKRRRRTRRRSLFCFLKQCSSTRVQKQTKWRMDIPTFWDSSKGAVWSDAYLFRLLMHFC